MSRPENNKLRLNCRGVTPWAPPVATAGRPRSDAPTILRILSDSSNGVDIAGNAASAKIVLDYPQVKFIDYMSLLKIDGEWKIINKTFDAQPKAK